MSIATVCTLYSPGDVVDWRPGPFASWSKARVREVEHCGDGQGQYTKVFVEPVIYAGSVCPERVLSGPTLATCLRKPIACGYCGAVESLSEYTARDWTSDRGEAWRTFHACQRSDCRESARQCCETARQAYERRQRGEAPLEPIVVNEQTCGVARPACWICSAELLFSARARGDGMCGPCSRRAEDAAASRRTEEAAGALIDRAYEKRARAATSGAGGFGNGGNVATIGPKQWPAGFFGAVTGGGGGGGAGAALTKLTNEAQLIQAAETSLCIAFGPAAVDEAKHLARTSGMTYERAIDAVRAKRDREHASRLAPFAPIEQVRTVPAPGSRDAIRAALLEVSGVTAVEIHDVTTRPGELLPGQVAVHIGGDAAYDEDIAGVLYGEMPFGIVMIGDCARMFRGTEFRWSRIDGARAVAACPHVAHQRPELGPCPYTDCAWDRVSTMEPHQAILPPQERQPVATPSPVADIPLEYRINSDVTDPLYALWIPRNGRPPQFGVDSLDANACDVITLDDEIDDCTLRDLLVADEVQRRDKEHAPLEFTPTQRAAVSAYHSAQLRAKVAATRAAEAERKLTVWVDRDLDEVE